MATARKPKRHAFTSEEAREAGRKGGSSVSGEPKRQAGRKGGLAAKNREREPDGTFKRKAAKKS